MQDNSATKITGSERELKDFKIELETLGRCVNRTLKEKYGEIDT